VKQLKLTSYPVLLAGVFACNAAFGAPAYKAAVRLTPPSMDVATPFMRWDDLSDPYAESPDGELAAFGYITRGQPL
jgi:hypothetical protein